MKRFKFPMGKLASLGGAVLALAAAVADPSVLVPLVKVLGVGVAAKVAAVGAVVAALGTSVLAKQDQKQ